MDAYKALVILDEAVDRLKWFESTMRTLTKGIPIDLTKERKELEWLVSLVEEGIKNETET